MILVLCLLLAESLGLLDGKLELLHELLVALVGGQVEAVEAGVGPWQPTVLPHLDTRQSRYTYR